MNLIEADVIQCLCRVFNLYQNVYKKFLTEKLKHSYSRNLLLHMVLIHFSEVSITRQYPGPN